jgi:hypothetical protein
MRMLAFAPRPWSTAVEAWLRPLLDLSGQAMVWSPDSMISSYSLSRAV